MMRVSEPNALLIRANTNSEWDECSFALIGISPEWVALKLEQLDVAQRIPVGISALSVNFFEGYIEFYKYSDFVDEILDIEEEFCFVSVDKETLEKSETRLGTFSAHIYTDGTVMFNAYGKETGEEFFTHSFNLQDLLRLC